jgi:polyisoprenoid-binding protein YceI
MGQMKIKVIPAWLLLMSLITACATGVEISETQTPAPTEAPGSTSTTGAPQEEPGQGTDDQVADNSDPEFVILPGDSEARFYIDEILRGQPKKVEGVTQEVSGSLLIESLDPLTVSMQPIEIQAANFVTDNNFRNRAINDAILQSGRYPTITFTPTSIDGLPGSAQVGQTYVFVVTGELTIRDITSPATFQVTLNAESEDLITGSASTTINRSDYQLNIPSVPQVADVSEQVLLEFDFSAGRIG